LKKFIFYFVFVWLQVSGNYFADGLLSTF
jgi:hypothetical protein